MNRIDEILHDMNYAVEQLELKALSASPDDNDRITAAVASLAEAIAYLQPLGAA